MEIKQLRFIFLLLVVFFLSFSLSFLSFSNERCVKLANQIRKAHFYYFGVDFPFWYSVAQAEKESNCRHDVFSSDGIGSEGFAQITFRWWQKELEKEGIKEISSIENHARAQAYINYYNYQRTVCKKLFEMYQLYNGSFVSKDLQEAKSCEWREGLKVCKPKQICVLKKNNTCLQYRTSCDINYDYSIKIYMFADKYRIGIDNKKYRFF